jgi:hypothetical protein
MTALPPSINFTGNITEGQLKQSFTELRDYLDGLLGTDGSTTTARSTLGAQIYSTSLDALTSATVSTDTMPYFNSSSSATNTTLTAFARTLLASIDASSALSTLGIKSSSSLQSYTAYTTTGSAPNYIVTLNYDIGASLATNTRLRVKFHSNGVGTVASPDMLQLIDTNNTFINKAIKYRGAGGTKHKFVPINNALLDLEFDGTDWVVLNPPAPLSSVVSTSVTSYTIDSFQYGTLFNFDASSCTVTLPPASTVGESWLCAIKAGDSSTIIIDPNASEVIDGKSSILLYANEACTCMCDGTAWKMVSKSATQVFLLRTRSVTTPLSGNITPTAGVLKMRVTVKGGGGGGGRGFHYDGGVGGGGGEGGSAVSQIIPASVFAYTIGAGGAGASGGYLGGTGGNSTALGMTGNGGTGGDFYSTLDGASPGIGGSGSGGASVITGQNGGSGVVSGSGGTGGGGGGGAGGNYSGSPTYNGSPASSAGAGGGGGANDSTGGAGASGVIIIEEYA